MKPKPKKKPLRHCETCIHFAQQSSDYGLCRHSPPPWEQVSIKDWCGEHQNEVLDDVPKSRRKVRDTVEVDYTQYIAG